MRKRIVYSRSRDVEMWTAASGSYRAKVITLVKEISFLGMKWHMVRQYIPKVRAFYDGEYDSNRRAKNIAREERVRVNVMLQFYKENGTWQYPDEK